MTRYYYEYKKLEYSKVINEEHKKFIIEERIRENKRGYRLSMEVFSDERGCYIEYNIPMFGKEYLKDYGGYPVPIQTLDLENLEDIFARQIFHHMNEEYEKQLKETK